MAVYKSTVLILRCQDWSETSQVIHLLAREVGRLRCLAKGSKRGQNPFSGPLDRWMLGDAVFSLGDPNRLGTLMELYETDRFEGIRRKLPAFYGASLVTELILTLVPDVDPQPAVFDWMVETLRQLSDAEAEACQAITFAFAWRLLGQLGYAPPPGRCVECGTALAAGKPADFNAASGGPVCGRCRGKGPTVRLGAKTVQAMDFLVSADWKAIGRVRLSAATANEMRAALTARVETLAGTGLSAAQYV